MSDFISELRREVVEAHARHGRGGSWGRAARLLHPRAWPVSRVALAPAAAMILLALALPVYLVTAVRPEPSSTPPQIVARFSPADSLGSAAAGFGSAWLDNVDANQLLRVDPRTRRVTARIAVRASASVTIGTNAVWAIESTGPGNIYLAGPLLRIDPRTDRVVARIALRTPAGTRFPANDAFAADGVVWVIGPDGALRIDARTNRVTKAITTSASGYEVADGALAGGDLFILRADGRLLRFDATTGARTGVVRAPTGSTLVTSGGGLIVVGQRDVVRVDPATGDALWRTRPGGTIGPAADLDGRLWLEATAGRGDGLVGIDPQTGRVVARVHVGEFQANALARVGGELWMTTPGGRVVVVRP